MSRFCVPFRTWAALERQREREEEKTEAEGSGDGQLPHRAAVEQAEGARTRQTQG